MSHAPIRPPRSNAVTPRAPRMVPALALAVSLALALAASPARAQRPHLDSLFWQPDFEAGFGDPQRVGQDLDRAARAGVRTVILQWLGHGEQVLLDVRIDGRDPVQVFLDEAHARGIDVWLGTWENPAIWRTRQVSLPAWRAAMLQGTALAAAAAERYGDHPALAGWYFTPEAVWWRPPAGPALERLTALTAEGVARLKGLTGHPVAIVVGPSGRGEANLLPISWCRYLEGTRPDVVVAMDGVGSAHLDVLLAPALYRVLHRCAERVGATLWADIELFGPRWTTPSLERLWLQYDAARVGTGHVSAFDLPHHLAEDTAAARFWLGERPPANLLPVRPLERTPPGPWTTARPRVKRGHVDVRLDGGAAEITRVEAIVRREAKAVSVDGLRPDGGVMGGGQMSMSHGPGRDEWTWAWDVPGSPERLAGVRVRVEGGRHPPEVLDVRLYGLR